MSYTCCRRRRQRHHGGVVQLFMTGVGCVRASGAALPAPDFVNYLDWKVGRGEKPARLGNVR
jgi:hypothetical protein